MNTEHLGLLGGDVRHFSRESAIQTILPVMSAVLMSAVLLAGCATVSPPGGGAAAVLLVDERQRAMVASADMAGLEQLAHANLRINAPGGRVLAREQFLANMRNGEIAAERFERKPEDVRISGDVAIVMGSEVFTPVATSELGRTFGPTPLQRRYTNVYVWESGRWQWLARHANVVPPGPR